MGQKELRSFVLQVFIVLIFRMCSGFLLAGGPRQLFCKKFTFASRCRHIVDRNSEFDLHGVLWSQGTPEEEDGYIG